MTSLESFIKTRQEAPFQAFSEKLLSRIYSLTNLEQYSRTCTHEHFMDLLLFVSNNNSNLDWNIDTLIGGVRIPLCGNFPPCWNLVCILFISSRRTKFSSSNRNILIPLYSKFVKNLGMCKFAITCFYLLYTILTTWCHLETYIQDTSR